jgi:purine-nucleoside phosphorylase
MNGFSAISKTQDPKIAAARLARVSKLRPALAIILGSGFREALTGMRVEKRISCATLPGFPAPAVSGHAGEVIFGHLGGTPVLVLSGRAHYYEGHSMDRVAFGVRVLAAFGIRDLLLTNAAGGIHPKFLRGDFMLLTDHLNLIGVNPLRGGPVEGLERFVDLTAVYDEKLGLLLRRAARQSGVKLRPGIYAAVSGPSYETPAEIRAFGRLGADAVGMSTVPEAIVARQCGLRVAAVSCITNLAARKNRPPISHAEVLETASQVNDLAAQMLVKFAKIYGRDE